MSTINLLPDDYLDRRRRQRTNVIGLFLFAAVMAGVAGAYVVSQRNLRQAIAVRDQVEAEYVEAAKMIEQMQQLQVRKNELMAKAKQAAALQERAPRSFVLAVLTNARPRHTSLTSVQLTLARPDDDKFAVASASRSGVAPDWDVRVKVQGLASTDVEVAKFIANLASCPLIRSVDLVYSREKVVDEVIPCRQFELVVMLHRGLDVLDVIQHVPPPRAAEADRPDRKGDLG